MRYYIWQAVQPFYVILLVPVILLFVVAIGDIGLGLTDREPMAATPVLAVLCGVYFLIGAVIFLFAPWYFRSHIKRRVKRIKDRRQIFIGADWETFSTDWRHYVGFDLDNNQALIVSCAPDEMLLLPFEHLKQFEVSQPRRNAVRFDIQTNHERCPSLYFHVDKRKAEEWRRKFLRLAEYGGELPAKERGADQKKTREAANR